MNKKPVFLDLTKIVLPYPALISILHRVSGVGLFFSFPFILPILGHIRSGGYLNYMYFLNTFLGKTIIWLISSALIYHILSAMRHFLSDFLGGESLLHSRLTAKITLFLAGVLIIMMFFKVYFL